MTAKKVLVKPKPATLRRAEKDLKNPNASRGVKGPAGYTVRNSKGVRVSARPPKRGGN